MYDVLRPIKRTTRRRRGDGAEWAVLLEQYGSIPGLHSFSLFENASNWNSVTPYLHPWHVKKRFDVAVQIKRECRERGLPEPVRLESFDEVDVGKNRKRRPIHFRRFRNRRGLTQPDRLGSFWRLMFPESIHGPLVLGFACHYGLGIFRPLQADGAMD